MADHCILRDDVAKCHSGELAAQGHAPLSSQIHPINQEVPLNTLIIGVGGTGAKIVEALVHLAPSNNAPHNIFTLLVDQDDSNGNVGLCRESLNNYRAVRDELKECGKEGGWAFCPVIKFEDELLPLKPDPGNNNFAAAIGLASMERNESLCKKPLHKIPAR